SGTVAQPLFSGSPFRRVILMGAGQSLVLGRLFSAEAVSALKQVKGLQTVPMFNSLLSSDHGKTRREIVIILTPETAPLPNTAPTPTPQSAPDSMKNQAPATPTARPPSVPTSKSGPYSLQLGAFANRAAAETLKQDLEKRYTDVFIDSTTTGRILHRVRLGHFPNPEAAGLLASRLKAEGFIAIV